jgi:hypothetical protein
MRHTAHRLCQQGPAYLRHFGVNNDEALARGDCAEALVGADELAYNTLAVQVESDRQLQGVECAEVVAGAQTPHELLRRLKVRAGDTNYLELPPPHVAAEPAPEELKVGQAQESHADFLGKDGVDFDHGEA